MSFLASPRSRSRSHGDTVEERPLGRTSEAVEFLEAGLIELPGVRTIIYIWQRLGFKGLVLALLLLGGPLGEYSTFSRFVNATVPRIAGDFGLKFEADDWSYHLFALKAIAHNVRVVAENRPGDKPIFTAADVEFEGSLGTVFGGLIDLALWRHAHTFNNIAVHHGELDLERSLTGRLNWDDAVESVPAARQQELASGWYHVNNALFTDLRIKYIEHIPGDSASGVIQTLQANIYIDAIEGSVVDVKPVEQHGELPTRVRFEGRSAEGVISIDGRVGFVNQPDTRNVSEDPSIRRVSDVPVMRRAASSPFYDFNILLNHVGAAAYAAMVPAPTRIVPNRGTVEARIHVVNRPEATVPACSSEVRLVDVGLTPNRRALTQAEYFRMLREAEAVRSSTTFDICPEFARPPDNQAQPHVASAVVLAAMNEQAAKNAAPSIRRAAALDRSALTGRASFLSDAVIGDVSDRLAARLGSVVGAAVGARTGAAVHENVAASSADGRKVPASEETPFAKGVKGVGHGIKKLFGGGKP